jgi:predicted  nucleic acid-binding Zn-ribbon protein
VSIWDGRAVKLMETLLVSAEVTPEIRSKLQPIVDRRTAIGRIDTEIDGLKRQQFELDERAQQTRDNLEAIKKDPAAASLRKKLSSRLEEFTKDGDAIGRKIVTLQSERLEKKIELEDLLQDLDLRAPAAKSSQ